MNKSSIDTILTNYRNLLNHVDEHIQKVEKQFPEQIACKKGCDSCCKFLSLFPVEALSISQAFSRLPQDMQTRIFKKLEHQTTTCPLLIDNACTLYSDRPVICRTHGYPIFMEKDGEKYIDFCPKNFKQVSSFPKETLLSVEQLNQTLIAVNQHVLEWIETDKELPDRIPISQAILITNEPK